MLVYQRVLPKSIMDYRLREIRLTKQKKEGPLELIVG